MLLPDVNVLVYAHRRDTPDHAGYRAWLEAVVNGPESFGLSDQVLSSCVSILTHPRIFARPTSLPDALAFADAVRSAPNRVRVEPGERHWGIFRDLCREANARGNLVPDAWLAALAIESGSEWITTDRDYARFPGLRWRHPLRRS
ncbi:MAG TPA: type II toxin-antitoxin system VapC family toxin [Myxococcota bacterium]|nr:type II toxin-antitoxin system VapC family toxin [Myxococcota bacterium]